MKRRNDGKINGVVNASCPAEVCTSGARQLTFTETAKDKALTCVSCEWSGKPAKELPTPFRFRVLDEINQQPVSGVPVSYSVISFTDKDGNTINQPNPRGSSIRPLNAETDIYGFSRAYLTLGTQVGTYIVRARCESCVSGQEQIAYGIARSRHVEIKAEKTTEADPEDTPIVQITQVLPPNNGKSFTTADGENYVSLQARLLGEEDQSLIRWTVEDDPHDFIPSGTPQLQYANGPVSGFTVRVEPAGGVPKAETGRARPLGYKIYAGADVPGKVVVSQRRIVRQDEIDKCRQEYMDIPAIRKLTPNYMDKIGRNRFTLGLDGDFVDKRYVRGCYAHIYPSRADEALRLISIVQPRLHVTSGYRSPMHNAGIGGVSNSSHMYGYGADVAFADFQITPARMMNLWDAAVCPMILERNGKPIELVVCDSDNVIQQKYLDVLAHDANGDGIPDIFLEAVKLHLGE